MFNINSWEAQLFKNSVHHFIPLYFPQNLILIISEIISLTGANIPMLHLKKFTVELAHKAGALLMDKFDRSIKINYKGDINLVTEADKLSEDLIITEIKRALPEHGILSEESPAIHDGSPMRWIIDPLDGTTNYAHSYPVFCVSIALEKDGVIILGVIYDPTRRETFVAERGKGAYLNNKKMAVSPTMELTRSLLATGFPYDIRESKENNLDYFNIMAKKVQALRRAGSAALDLAYVATGRFDGFWELKLMPWDMAAGCLMVEEAGGKVTTINGGFWNLSSPDILVSNGRIHEQMITALQRA
jgi:myo-inositol-1(or 4)-monophosphatase